MKLVKINKEQALGGRLTEDGKNVVVAIKEGGNTIIEIIEATAEIVGEIIEKATPLYLQLKSFFDDVFNTLPTYIIVEGVQYRLTLQPAGGKSLDYVFYMSLTGELLKPEQGTTRILFACGGQNMNLAKNQMYELLTKKGYIL